MTTSLLGGRLRLEQPRRGEGFRVTVDALLLAREALALPGAAVLDLGAGTGAVGLAIAACEPSASVVLVERDSEAAGLARANAARAGDRARVVESDVALLRLGAAFARVVCNPPFYRAGPRAAEPRREAARHGELDPFLEAASRHLSDGRALFVYPATDSHHLFAAARGHGLALEACRWVFPSPDRDARLVLARFAPSAFASAAVEVLAPLYEWSADGTPDASLAAFLRGETISGELADDRA